MADCQLWHTCGSPDKGCQLCGPTLAAFNIYNSKATQEAKFEIFYTNELSRNFLAVTNFGINIYKRELLKRRNDASITPAMNEQIKFLNEL